MGCAEGPENLREFFGRGLGVVLGGFGGVGGPISGVSRYGWIVRVGGGFGGVLGGLWWPKCRSREGVPEKRSCLLRLIQQGPVKRMTRVCFTGSGCGGGAREGVQAS